MGTRAIAVPHSFGTARAANLQRLGKDIVSVDKDQHKRLDTMTVDMSEPSTRGERAKEDSSGED